MTRKTDKPVALVTGGRRGLGRACALALADAGFDVVILDCEQDEAVPQTLSDLRARGAGAAFVHGDISDVARHAGLVDAAWDAFGGIDCLVDNAGLLSRPPEDLLDMSVEKFDRSLGVNLRGTFFLTQRVAKRMIAAGPSGAYRSIIVMSSVAAGIVSVRRGEYCMGKAALSMMTRLFAARLADEGIFVHEIRPGLIFAGRTVNPDATTKLLEGGAVPFRRGGDPAEIGATVAILAQGKLPYTTGQPFFVDGGLHLQRMPDPPEG